MALYGLKYLCEYRSKMRGKLLYRIEIEERDALALPDSFAKRMHPSSEVFTIKWGNADDAEYTAVKGSTLTLKLLCMHDMEYLALFTTDPRRYRVTVYEYRDGAVGPVRSMLWRGFLSANSYKEDFARPPYRVTLTATDGLSLLKAMPFRDANGAKFTGTQSLYGLCRGLSEALGLDLPIQEWTNLIEPTGPESTPSFFHIHVDTEHIYRAYEHPTWRDILDLCTQPFNAQIFQAHGVFHIRRILSLLAPGRPAGFDPDAAAMGRERFKVLKLWQENCDVNASTELSLLAPVRSATIKVRTERKDASAEYYNRLRWRAVLYGLTPDAKQHVWAFPNRIAFYGSRSGPVTVNLPGAFSPSKIASVSVSMDIFNRNGYKSLDISAGAAVAIGGSDISQAHPKKRYVWNEAEEKWIENGKIDGHILIEPSPKADLSPFAATDGLSSQTIRFHLKSLPDGIEGETYGLLVELYVAYEGFSDAPLEFTVSNVSCSYSGQSLQPSIEEVTVPIHKEGVDKPSWTIPVRDGGYHANALSLLPAVLLGSDARTPVVSWVAPTESGSLMGLAAHDIRCLRSRVARQLSGEMRCWEGADLNSLFLDDEYTGTVYYINSLELLAARQVYKVQLRGLLDTARWIPPYRWIPLRQFTDGQRIMASLDDRLFLRTGSGPYGVEIYDPLTDEVTALPYTGGRIDIRKGQRAVVVEVGDTSDLYAVDAVGEVLSRPDASAAEILRFDTALYDADRNVWVSFDATSTAGKTEVTILSKEMELHAQNRFDITASRLLLTSNGYLLVDKSGNTYWHSYELHTPDTLLAVNDPSDPITPDQWEAVAVSDAILVKFVTEDALTHVGRRYGLKVHSTERVLAGEPSNTYLSGSACNNRLAVLGGERPGVPSQVWACDMRTGRNYGTEIPHLYGVGAGGSCAYFLGSDAPGAVRQLYCLTFEETCYTKIRVD